MSLLKYLLVSVCVFFVLIPTNADELKPGATEIERILADFSLSLFDELQIIKGDERNSANLLWVTWSERSADSKNIKLALIKKSSSQLIVLQIIERSDAYHPRIKRVVDWRYANHPVLALEYQMGAAAEMLELYGVDDQNEIQKVAEFLGEFIAWDVSLEGRTQLAVYSRPDSHLKPTLYQWDSSSQSLIVTSTPLDCRLP